MIRSGQCRGIVCATPCTTYSCARRPAVRSRPFPRGLKNLTGADLEAVQRANRLTDHTVLLLDAATKYSVPWVLENPPSSLLWSEKGVQRLAQLEESRSIRLHMCAFGARWRKPTMLLCNRVLHPERLQKLCRTVAPDYLCSFTQKPHIALRGKDSNDIPWTRRAQEYPPQFASQLASAILETAWTVEFAALASERLGRRWEPP